MMKYSRLSLGAEAWHAKSSRTLACTDRTLARGPCEVQPTPKAGRRIGITWRAARVPIRITCMQLSTEGVLESCRKASGSSNPKKRQTIATPSETMQWMRPWWVGPSHQTLWNWSEEQVCVTRSNDSTRPADPFLAPIDSTRLQLF